MNDSAWVEGGKRQPVQLLLEQILHDDYPHIAASSRSFVPCVLAVYFQEAYKEPLPFGVSRDGDAVAVGALLGPPVG